MLNVFQLTLDLKKLIINKIIKKKKKKALDHAIVNIIFYELGNFHHGNIGSFPRLFFCSLTFNYE